MNPIFKSFFVLCVLLLCTPFCHGKEAEKNHYDPIIEKLGKPTKLVKKTPSLAELHYRLSNGDDIIMTVDSGFLIDTRHKISIPGLIQSIKELEIEHWSNGDDNTIQYWDVKFTDEEIQSILSLLKSAKPWVPSSLKTFSLKAEVVR